MRRFEAAKGPDDTAGSFGRLEELGRGPQALSRLHAAGADPRLVVSAWSRRDPIGPGFVAADNGFRPSPLWVSTLRAGRPQLRRALWGKVFVAAGPSRSRAGRELSAVGYVPGASPPMGRMGFSPRISSNFVSC